MAEKRVEIRKPSALYLSGTSIGEIFVIGSNFDATYWEDDSSL